MKYYSYSDLETDTKILVSELKEHQFETIVALARGGMILGQLIAYALDIRDIQTLKIESYDDEKKRDYVTITNTCNIKDGAKVLIVDDIVDSGDTLKKVIEHLNEKYLHVELMSASIFYKKSALVEPDFKVKEAKEWIDFFWESDYL
ncbi:MAG: phosphoribosyltransferase family protein [Campylobacterota bacterium]|nr:phosphoribosyltransferase family protein [Campylobacterota bacterium]